MREKVKYYIEHFTVRLSNYGLLAIISFILFALPVIPHPHEALVFNLGITIIILLSIEATSQNFNTPRTTQVIIAIIAIWVSLFTNHHIINIIARFFLFSFFMIRVAMFIKQLSKKRNVTGNVIIESINGYLLMGIGFGLLVAMLCWALPNSFNFSHEHQDQDYLNPYYYAFVTMTTLGYGDFLPLTNAAKAISILICITGQIYLVTVMALLIGRLLGEQNKNKE